MLSSFGYICEIGPATALDSGEVSDLDFAAGLANVESEEALIRMNSKFQRALPRHQMLSLREITRSRDIELEWLRCQW
jgi:hypothetical protein